MPARQPEESASMVLNPVRATPFANFSNVMLADAMGEIDRDLDALKERQEAARKEMTRRKLASIEGVRFIVVKATTETHTFDSRAVRAEMGDDWYEARQKPGTRTTFTVVAKPDEDGTPADPRAAAEALFRR